MSHAEFMPPRSNEFQRLVRVVGSTSLRARRWSSRPCSATTSPRGARGGRVDHPGRGGLERGRLHRMPGPERRAGTPWVEEMYAKHSTPADGYHLVLPPTVAACARSAGTVQGRRSPHRAIQVERRVLAFDEVEPSSLSVKGGTGRRSAKSMPRTILVTVENEVVGSAGGGSGDVALRDS